VKHIILTVAGLLLATGPGFAQQAAPVDQSFAPSDQDSAPAGNIANGKALYVQVGCYQCHGLAGQGARMTGPRVSQTQFPFESFVYQLRQPANQMPPYEATIISDQAAADIYAYIRQMPVRDPNDIPLLKATR
jgi:mono/diheme cytochrome c family protein